MCYAVKDLAEFVHIQYIYLGGFSPLIYLTVAESKWHLEITTYVLHLNSSYHEYTASEVPVNSNPNVEDNPVRADASAKSHEAQDKPRSTIRTVGDLVRKGDISKGLNRLGSSIYISWSIAVVNFS